jgi:pyridoxine kinase
VFPLQLLGFDVDIINSVHFSNHTGYTNGWTGDVLKGEQLREILSGLQRNDLLQDIGHVLTGYVGSASFLDAILDVILACRAVNPHVRYVCDPVLGDAGRFYVPQELVSLYMTKVIPLADVLTPNQFEVEQLTGMKITSLDDAQAACRQLHDMGPSLVIITSLVMGDNPTHMSIVLSRKHDDDDDDNDAEPPPCSIWTIECPILPGQYTGTGDLCAALLLAHTSEYAGADDGVAMERVINTMYAILERTTNHAAAAGRTATMATTSVQARELKLIQSKDIIENPPLRFRSHRL